MNYGRLALAAVVATVVDLAYGFVVFGMVFSSVLTSAPAGVFRTVEQTAARWPAAVGGTLIGMLAATFIYAKGYEGKSGLGEGLRFGLLIGLLEAGYFSIATSAVMNYGYKLAAIFAIANIPEWLLVGAVVGMLYRPAAAARLAAAR
jgi:hypothetical protein